MYRRFILLILVCAHPGKYEMMRKMDEKRMNNFLSIGSVCVCRLSLVVTLHTHIPFPSGGFASDRVRW